jgi:hypothetical protein
VLDNADGADDALFHTSPMAFALSNNMWRVVDTFLKAGLGERQPVTLASFVRYLARINFLQCTVRSLLNLAWVNEYYAFRDDDFGVDRVVFDKFVDSIGLLDPSNVIYLQRIIREMSGLPTFPNFTNEAVRMLEPYLVDDVENTLHIPQFIPWEESTTVGAQLDLCRGYLDYITGSLSAVTSALSNFIPTNFMDTALLAEPAIGYDPIKTSGAFNSALEMLNVVGSASSPDDDENTMILIENVSFVADIIPGKVVQSELSDSDGVPFMSKHDSLMAMEFLSATVWLEERDQTPDRFYLLTPHQWGRIVIFNDDETTDVIDGSNLSSTLDHLAPFLNTKFPGASDELRIQPGYKSSQLLLNPSLQTVTRFGEVLLHVDQMMAISRAMMGRAVKFGREEVKAAFL